MFCILVILIIDQQVWFYRVLGTEGTFLARQASEQYFTSAQFLAQLLRQVMSRPQATQGLLGSAALLPLKLISIQCVVIVMRISAVIAPAQLHRQVLVGVSNSLNAQQGRSMLYF